MLCDLLKNNGYAVKTAYSGTEALLLTESNGFSAVLLDLMLPGLSGEEVIKKIREQHDMVIIAVSAKDDQKAKIELLKLGADDYVTKPFDTDELLARLEAQLRRYLKPSNTNRASNLTYKDLVLNTETFEVYAGGNPVNVTKREFLLLSVLIGNPKKVFTKNNLYQAACNDEFFGDDNTVNVHISNLRSKLAKASPDVEYIQTVWGIGFKMCD
jgi:DNA-binding response OmpR family regulator